jgi:hypothetical protein
VYHYSEIKHHNKYNIFNNAMLMVSAIYLNAIL